MYDLGLSEHERSVVSSWERVGVRRLRVGDQPSASADGGGRRDPMERGALSEWDVLHTAAAEMQHVVYGAHASAGACGMRHGMRRMARRALRDAVAMAEAEAERSDILSSPLLLPPPHPPTPFTPPLA